MLVEACRQLLTAVGECVEAPAWQVSELELLDCLDTVFTAQQRLSGVLAHLAHEADGRGIPRAEGAVGLGPWLRDRLKLSPSSAKRLAELVKFLAARPASDAALSDGAVTVDQLTVIGATVALLRDGGDVEPEVVDKAEAELLGHAAMLDPKRLEKCGRRIVHLVDPEHAEERAERVRRRAQAGRTLSLAGTAGAVDGLVRIAGWLDSEAAAIVRAALDPLCRPTPGDDRSPGQRRADALTEVCALALRCTELPDNGGDRPQVTVTVPFDPVRNLVGPGVLDDGAELTPDQVRRVACDAQIIPAVLGGDGEALDVGRARRLFTGATRRALVLRDGGCAFPNCDRPPRWCDAHHIVSWLDGGGTDLDNGVLLCGYHHRLIHHTGWDVRLGADRRPEFLPPVRLDPLRRPRRNTYHRRT
ncbi:MAG TPA: DUF222 domain-containing protein [Micromonosporaceae bacterium]|nr:DUF222 domain-containing protein [Micromonosporaceae bacterium]